MRRIARLLSAAGSIVTRGGRVVDEVRRQRPDRVGTEAATLGGGREEKVDAGVAEVWLGLLRTPGCSRRTTPSSRIAKPSSSG